MGLMNLAENKQFSSPQTINPDPFMDIISEQGLPWEIVDYA